LGDADGSDRPASDLASRRLNTLVCDVELRGRAAYFDDPAALVVADVHVGRDEASDVSFPLGERDDLRERLDALVAHFRPDTVVVAGDVLHTYGYATDRASAVVDAIADCCRDAGARLVLVRGNHDTSLDGVWEEAIHDDYRLGDVVVAHGHDHPEPAADCYVVGHDHPTIEIEGQRRPCFLYGEGVYRGSDVLMLPAFNRLAAGVSVNEMGAEDFQSPLVVDVDAFRPAVYDEDAQETLWFPPLGEFRSML
jgi:putative SbcD/Mre11-related phosphoesterase